MLAHLLSWSGSCSFFIQSVTIFLENGATHSGLSPPVAVNNKDNHVHTYPETTNMRKTITKLRRSFQVILGYVKLRVNPKEDYNKAKT